MGQPEDRAGLGGGRRTRMTFRRASLARYRAATAARKTSDEGQGGGGASRWRSPTLSSALEAEVRLRLARKAGAPAAAARASERPELGFRQSQGGDGGRASGVGVGVGVGGALTAEVMLELAGGDVGSAKNTQRRGTAEHRGNALQTRAAARRVSISSASNVRGSQAKGNSRGRLTMGTGSRRRMSSLAPLVALGSGYSEAPGGGGSDGFASRWGLHWPQGATLPLLWPDSAAVAWFDALVLLACIYTALAVPLRAAMAPLDNAQSTVALGYLCDAVFAADILLSFITIRESAGGSSRGVQAVASHASIARAYAGGWLAVDVIGLVLAHAARAACGAAGSCAEVTRRALWALKAPRMLRATRSPLVANLLAHSASRSSSTNVAALLGRLMTNFYLVAHWVGCIWLALGEQGSGEGADAALGDWVGDFALRDEVPWLKFYGVEDAPLLDKYTLSVHWAFTTMTTIGYGDIVPHSKAERAFTIFIFLVGSLMYATIFGNVAMIVRESDAAGERYRQRLGAMGEVVRFFDLPEELALRVINNQDYSLSLSGGIDIVKTLAALPRSLRSDVTCSLYEHVVRSVPLFMDMERPMIKEICLRLRPEVLMPGDTLYYAGDSADEMAFVGSGLLEVVLPLDRRVIATISSGALVGESCLFGARRRLADVVAVQFSEIYTLSLAGFQEVLRAFPEVAGYIKQEVDSQVTARRFNVTTKQFSAEDAGGDPSAKPPSRCPSPDSSQQRGTADASDSAEAASAAEIRVAVSFAASESGDAAAATGGAATATSSESEAASSDTESQHSTDNAHNAELSEVFGCPPALVEATLTESDREKLEMAAEIERLKGSLDVLSSKHNALSRAAATDTFAFPDFTPTRTPRPEAERPNQRRRAETDEAS